MIVVGIDGSEGSEKALTFAAGEAALRRQGLRIVAAWHVPTSLYAHGFFVSPEVASGFEQSAHATAESQTGKVDEGAPGGDHVSSSLGSSLWALLTAWATSTSFVFVCRE
jgi:nucleotide-binding universal stress UspA family protein